MATGIDYESNVLRRFENWSVYLHPDQSYLGRTYVALDRGEEGEEVDPFLDVDPGERDELVMIFGGLSDVLDVLYQPTRLNYSNLRNTWRKCLWHVVPRYEGGDLGLRVVHGFEFRDMNPGRNYAPSPQYDVPLGVFGAIKSEMADALAVVEL